MRTGRHRVDAKAQAAARPFEHIVLVHPTTFQPAKAPNPDKRVEFQALYQALIDDEARNRRICDDVVESLPSLAGHHSCSPSGMSTWIASSTAWLVASVISSHCELE